MKNQIAKVALELAKNKHLLPPPQSEQGRV
jgi:hypothetical protein